MAVPEIIKELTTKIRNATLGGEITKSIADGIDFISGFVTDNQDRQDQVEKQFQQVIDETTGKDIVSAPEIIAARNGKDNLKDRIDTFENDTTAQLAQTTGKLEKGNNRFYESSTIGYLSFIFDDQRKEVFDVAYPIFQSEGVPASLAVILKDFMNPPSTAINPKDIQTMYQKGWEILSHGMRSLNITSSSSDSFSESEIVQSKKELEKLGFEINGFVAPGGSLDVNRMPLVEDTYEFSFCNYTYNLVDYNGSIYNINRVDMAGKTVAEIKTLMDLGSANNQWLVLFDHNIGTTGHISESDLREVVQYGKALGMNIDTPSGVIDKVSTALVKQKSLRDQSKKIDYANNLVVNPRFKGEDKTAADDWLTVKTVTSGSINTEIRQYSPFAEYIVKFNAVAAGNNFTQVNRIPFKTNISTTGKLQIPLYCNGNDRTVRIQVRAYSGSDYLYKLTDETLEPALIYSTYEKDFAVPHDPAITTIEIRITAQALKDNNTFNFFLGSPCLTINNMPKLGPEYHAVYLTSDQTLSATAGSTDTIVFNDILLSTGGFNAATGTLTAENSGIFKLDINLSVVDSVDLASGFNLIIELNGVDARQLKDYKNMPAGEHIQLQADVILPLKEGDVVKVKLSKDAANACRIDRASYFNAYKLA